MRYLMSMTSTSPFDFWYAVNNTQVLIPPRQQLETFGSTTLYYHLVAETMDTVNQIRVREGRIHAYRPQIITPENLGQAMLEGFQGEQVDRYMDWMKENESHLVLLQYGFAVRKESINEHIVTDTMANVLDRVADEVRASPHPMHALLRGVDEPWEVCLLKLISDVVQRSAPHHAQQLKSDPTGARHEIENLFLEASRDSARIPALSRALEQSKLFKDYEDRFFALVRAIH
jgi:hypothetical protein